MKFTKWYCLPCQQNVTGDTEGLAADSHLQSKKHIQNVAAMVVPCWHCIHCPVWVPEEQRAQHERKRTHRYNVSIRQGKVFECEICGKTMALECKMQHLYGKKHISALAAISKNCDIPYEQLETAIPEFTRARGHRKPLPPWEWECEICNKRMQAKDQEFHLRGKSHQEVVESLELPIAVYIPPSPAGQEKTETSIPETTREYTIVPRWECEICKKEMQAKDKEPHLQGKKHQEALQSIESIATTSISANAVRYVNEQQTETTTSQSSEGQTIIPPWECILCNKRMSLLDKEPHLRGRKHLEVLQSLELIAITSSPTTQYERPESSISKSTLDQPILPKWECTICNKRMQLLDKDPHLRGKGHQSALLYRLNKTTTTRDYSGLFPKRPVAHVPTTANATGPTTWSKYIETYPEASTKGTSDSEDLTNKIKSLSLTAVKKPTITLDHPSLFQKKSDLSTETASTVSTAGSDTIESNAGASNQATSKLGSIPNVLTSRSSAGPGAKKPTISKPAPDMTRFREVMDLVLYLRGERTKYLKEDY